MKFIIATSQKEADSIASDSSLSEVHHTKLSDAEDHLKEVRSPPTDPYYASQYKIYRTS